MSNNDNHSLQEIPHIKKHEDDEFYSAKEKQSIS